jgi:hypothetical protein
MSKKIENPPVEENPDIVAHRLIEQKLEHYCSNGGSPATAVCCSCTALFVAVIYVISVACTWQHTDTYTAARFEQVLVDHSPSWFAQVHVVPQDTRTQSFLLSQLPAVVAAPSTFHDQYVFPLNASYGYVDYTLLSGSKISMTYTSVPTFPLGFYMLPGRDFERWQNDWARWGPNNGQPKWPIEYSTSPYGAINYTTMPWYPNRASQHLYFIWASTSSLAGTVYANFSLDVQVYDNVANRVRECQGTCDFNLDYGSAQVVLISPFNMFANGTQETISSTGISRFTTWFSLGLGITAPFALLAFAFSADYFWLRLKLWRVKKRLEKSLASNVNMYGKTVVGAHMGEKQPILGSNINAI